jgi:hypothetical protein
MTATCVLRAAVLLCACVAGCAGQIASSGIGRVLPAGDPGSAVVGGSTKAAVLAALGPTTSITFDSGFEVWVYRLDDTDKPGSGKGEYVILFTPAGVVARTRLRRAPHPEPGGV